jgi:hypothetical protein
MNAPTKRTAAVPFQRVFIAGSADTSIREAGRETVRIKAKPDTATTLKIAITIVQNRSLEATPFEGGIITNEYTRYREK